MRFMMMAALTFVLAVLASCKQSVLSSGNNGNAAVHGRAEVSLPAEHSRASVKSISFYGRWWDEEQMSADFDADNPPPPKARLKLEQWDASGGNDFPHPDRIDVLCVLENEGRRSADFRVTALGEFKVAAYEWVQNYESDITPDERLSEVPWTERTDIGHTDVRNVAPGEAREVTFRDFDLRAVINKFSAAGDERWPWKLRVSVVIETVEGVEVGKGEMTLDIFPAD